jgi:hypothetical protein
LGKYGVTIFWQFVTALALSFFNQLFYSFFINGGGAAVKCAYVMTTTTGKKVSLKSLANNESKAEMFSKKTALTAIKSAYDVKEGNCRAYINSLGFSANVFKSLTIEMLDEYIAETKSGRYSTYGIFNAISKYAQANKISAAKKVTKKSAPKAEPKAEQTENKGILGKIFGK